MKISLRCYYVIESEVEIPDDDWDTRKAGIEGYLRKRTGKAKGSVDVPVRLVGRRPGGTHPGIEPTFVSIVGISN